MCTPFLIHVEGGLNYLTRTLFRLANKHFLKVADLAALKADYAKAITNFEKVAKSSINNNLMKWSVKEYFMKAIMCHLASKVYILIHLPTLSTIQNR